MAKSDNMIFRLSVLLLALIPPFLFVARGFYGSFVFVFSIPLIWQVVLRGMPLRTLGLRPIVVWQTVGIGGLTGCSLGLAGGLVLKYLGITGHSFGDLDALKLALGSWEVSFSLRNELSYRLLEGSHTVLGWCRYLVFSIFVIGLGEELFWRGFIQAKIARYLSPLWAIVITSFLFALIHFYICAILDLKAAAVLLSLIAVAGGVWGCLFVKYGSLWPLAVSHGIAAFIIWKYFFFTP